MPQLYANLLGTYLRKWGFERKHKANRWGYYVSKKGPVADVNDDAEKKISVYEAKPEELLKENICMTIKKHN
jgi:hypothetical protein